MNIVLEDSHVSLRDATCVLNIMECEESIELLNFVSYMSHQLKAFPLSFYDILNDFHSLLVSCDLEKRGCMNVQEVLAILEQYVGSNSADALSPALKIMSGKSKEIYITELIQFLKQPTSSKKEVKAFKVLLYLRKKVNSLKYSLLPSSHLMEDNLLVPFYYLEIDKFDKSYNVSNNKNCITGYITFHSLTLNSNQFTKPDNSQLRILVRFYNKATKTLLPGCAFVNINSWTFNKASEIGTNPIAYKWSGSIQYIDIIFELVVCTSNQYFSLGHISLSLEKLNKLFDYVLDLMDSDNKVGKLLLGIRPFNYLSLRKQKYLDALPATCLVNKRLLSFCVIYINYLKSMFASFNRFEIDIVNSQFMKVMSNVEVIDVLIKYWSQIEYCMVVIIVYDIRVMKI